MPQVAHTSSIYRFGVFLVDLRKGELLKHGTRIRIQDKPFQLLSILLERAGEVVTREQLQERLWPADTFVEFDDGLNAAVKKLRYALSDATESPRFIATVPRRGYCFIAPVVREADGSSDEEANIPEALPQSAADSLATLPAPKVSAVRKKLLFVATLLTVCLASAWSGIWKFGFLGRRSHSGAASDLKIVPVTSLPGEERMPAFSPESGRLAFVWQAPDKKLSGIYEVVVDSQSMVRLTSDPSDSWPAWSADGRYIAFERYSGRKVFIYLIPALGGPERLLYSGEHTPWTGPDGLSFSPDGRFLAFGEWTSETQQSSIRLISLDGSGIRTLTSPPPGFRDAAPVFSHDGNRIAFVRSTGPIFIDEIFIVPVSGGTPTQITFDRRRMSTPPVWTEDGRELIFSSNRAGIKSLWRIPVEGGTPTSIAGVGPGTDRPTLSSASGELAYEYSVQDENFWRVELRNNVGSSPPHPLLAPRTHNLMPQFSPDGTKVAFESDRSGYEEIWVCNPDGTNPVQLTFLERYSGSPRWSPDGRHIAFDFRSGQHAEIYVVDLANGSPHSLVSSLDADNVVPSWSHDGKWVYFASNRGSKDFRIWKVSANGGVPLRVTNGSGFVPFETPDGRSLFYSRLTQPGIWKVPVDGGSEKLVCLCTQPDDWADWTVTDSGLYFVDTKTAALPQIEFMDLKSGKISQVGKMERPVFVGLTISPDKKTIVYSQRDRDEHDILMMRAPQ